MPLLYIYTALSNELGKHACLKYYLDSSTLSRVIAWTLCFPQILSKIGHNSAKIWWNVTLFNLDCPFIFTYILIEYYSILIK